MAKASGAFWQAEDVIKSLKRDGRIFVSEAHFQLSFAMRAKDMFGAFEYIPEYSVEENNKRSEFDLLIRNPDGGSGTLIEFKYKLTNRGGERSVRFPIQGNGPGVPPFKPKADGTLELIRYDCWKDIARVERFVKPQDTEHEKYQISNGFFILITNNPRLWDIEKTKHRRTGIPYPYSLANGPHPAKTLQGFDKSLSNPALQVRTDDIIITNDYNFEYKDYYGDASSTLYENFKYLIVEISSN